MQADGAIRPVNPGGIIAPGGLTVVGDTLYLADFLSIRGYDRQTGAQTVMIPKIYGISALNDPLVVAPDGENLLVTSWLYSTVQVVAPKTGAIVATYSDFNTPTNAIRFQGDLLVSELGSGSVVRARGADLAQRETLLQNLKEPIGLAATEEAAWVSDSATGTVWQLIAGGEPLAEPKAVATDLAMPEGLALDKDGALLVVEAGAGRLSAIDLESGERQTLATGLQTGLATANAPSFWIFNGVAVDASGNIYVSGDVANVIYRFPAAQPQASLDAATTAKIDAIIQKAMTDYPTPGFTMCIVKDGQVVYHKGFGWADVEHQRPMTPRSVSTEYSIAKSMTAMAVMQLVEQGKVNLDEPVTTYLPYFTMADARYPAITVRMLLNHTSGMPDDPWDFALTGDADPLEQAVRSLRSKSLLAAPGAAWSYSSLGYTVLGDLIAKVSGESFPMYMQQHLLQPMGMLHSTFVPEEVDPALRVLGYVDAKAGGIEVGGPHFPPYDAPAANLSSNCEEMAQWAMVMLNQGKVGERQLLTAESIEAMWTNGVATPWRDIVGPWYGGALQTYSLGWHLGNMAGHRLVGNAGAEDGFNTQMQFAPDDGLAVIAMNNWLNFDTATWYPASFAAIDVMYTLLGIKPE